MNIDTYLKKHWGDAQHLTNQEIADKFQTSEAAVRRHIKKLNLTRQVNLTERVSHEYATTKLETEKRSVEKKYKEALKRIESLEKERDLIVDTQKTLGRIPTIKSEKSDGGESVAFIVVSDTHVDERVLPEEVNGLNEFNEEIAKERMTNLFVRGHKLIKMAQRDSTINTVVIPILGDIISNRIHDELAETNTLGQSEAITFAYNLLVSGIEYIAKDDTIKKIHVVCHTGNHGRTTNERRNGKNEYDNSVETILYWFIANHFKDSAKVKVEIPKAQLSYMEVLGTTVRFMHGHSVSYSGGIGGLTIPLNKAIARYDVARKADLTVLGHFHQFFDGGRFIVNGSVAGVTAYSLKYGYEPPRQAFFLITKAYGQNRGKSIVAPIWVD